MFDKIKKILNGEVVRYLVFGVLTTVVNFIVYFTVTAIFGDHTYLAANIAAWVVAVAFAYVTNKLFVFESKSWEKAVVVKELGAFVSARVFSLLVEELGLFVMIDLLRFDAWSIDVIIMAVSGATIAKLAMQFVVIVLNYIFSKLVIFKKKQG